MASNHAKIIGIAPQILVEDVVMTANYYRDVLGFQLIDYFLDPPVYAMVQRDGFQIHFAKGDQSMLQPNHKVNMDVSDLILWIPDIDNYYREVKDKGATIVQEIVKRIYGSREFVLEDCNGYRITVGD